MSFIVYPALDIRDGRVVRLRQGDYAQETSYGDDPLPRARAFAAAMDQPEAFYDAVGDAARHKRHYDAMMESCHRFIDYRRIDVIPTSQYDIKPLF